MKNIIWLMVFLGVIMTNGTLSAFADSPPRTSSNIYLESFSSQFKKDIPTERTVEYRADQYRNQYEQCDENHSCSNVTSGSKRAKQNEADHRTQKTVPFLNMPVWS